MKCTPSPGGKHLTAMFDFELLKYGMTQGGLTLVCIVVFYFYRRDVLKKAKDAEDVAKTLIAIVEKNAIANTRLASALERQHLGAAGDGPVSVLK